MDILLLYFKKQGISFSFGSLDVSYNLVIMTTKYFPAEVPRFDNYDLDNIITPVDPVILECLLQATHYDENETKFLVDGFTHGFDLCYEGPHDKRDLAPNLPLQVGDKLDVLQKNYERSKSKTICWPIQI